MVGVFRVLLMARMPVTYSRIDWNLFERYLTSEKLCLAPFMFISGRPPINGDNDGKTANAIETASLIVVDQTIFCFWNSIVY